MRPRAAWRVTLGLLCAALGVTPLAAQRPAPLPLVPKPVLAERRAGEFVLDRRTVIVADSALLSVAEATAEQLRSALRLPLTVRTSAARGALRFVLDSSVVGVEAYQLDVRAQGITIRASAPAGAFYGMQTLRQLLPASTFGPRPPVRTRWVVPAMHVEDAPRFSWRGAHLDVVRHFMPVSFVKRWLDLMALHKLNRFHWHLTDDQGWRLEIRRYPRFTEIGGCRAQTMVGRYESDPLKRRFDGTPHCGHYTQAEAREIVAYAAARFITVVPEIEMPGHAQAAIAAYPALGVRPDTVLTPREFWGVSKFLFNADSSTIAVLQDVLTEVLELFPSPWIHVGGDEAVKDYWRTSPAIQERIRELGVTDEAGLQSWFIGQMDTWLTARGRRLIGWDEILQGGLAPNATVMSWRGIEGGIEAAQAGHDVVMTPTSHTYFDYYQARPPKREPLAIGGFVPLEKVYAYNPVPASLNEEQARRILGTQGQLWTEYLATPAAVEYMAYPRLSALAEVAWSPMRGRAFTEFRRRLVPHLGRLEAMGVRYRRLDPVRRR